MGGRSSKNREEIEKLTANLRSVYENGEIPNLKWMTRRSNFVTKDYYVQFHLNNHSKAIPIDKILSTEDDTPPTRILLVTQNDYEKKIFAYKFAYDWAKEENYLSSFRFVFIIYLRDLKDKTVQEEIEEIVEDLDVKIKGKKLYGIVNDKQTLMILIGLDELSSSSRKNVNKLLQKDQYKNVTVISTCRRDIFKSKNKNGWVFNESTKNFEFSDRKITILSLDSKNRSRFIDKLMMVSNKEKVRGQIVEVIKMQEDVFSDCPLFFLLLIFIILNNENVEIKSKTHLFKEFVNHIIRMSVKSVGRGFDLFSDDQSVEQYKNLFYRFGKLCSEKILLMLNNSALVFQQDDISDEIYRLGFLMVRNESIYSNRKRKNENAYYEGFYLSIYEFLAAFALTEEWKRNVNRFPKKSINDLNRIFAKSGSKSMTVSFVCGFLGENSVDLFRKLKSCAALYSTNEKAMILILEQIPLNDEKVSDFMSRFIPPEMFISGSLNSALKEVIKSGVAVDRILKLNVMADQIWNLPKDLQEVMLRINLNTDFPSNRKDKVYDMSEKLKCHKVTFVFLVNFKTDIESLKQYLSLFNSIVAELKSWYCYEGVLYPTLMQCINNGALNGSTIHELTFVLSATTDGKDIVEYIITHNKVNQLTLIIEDGSEIIDIKSAINTASMSRELNNLKIYNYSNQEVLVNLQELTLNETKTWNSLWLYNIHVECSQAFSHPMNISTYLIEKCKFRGRIFNVLCSIAPTHVSCDYNTLKLMYNNLSPNLWNGWGVIEELVLVFQPEDSKFTFDQVAAVSMEKLKKLKINLRKNLTEKEQNDMVSFIKFLQISQFGVEWETEFFQTVSRMMEIVKKCCRHGEMPKLVSVDVFVNDCRVDKNRHNMRLLMAVLLSCLEVECPKMINVVAVLANDLHLLLRENIVDFKFYKVEHVATTAPMRLSYFEYRYDICHVLIIKLK